MVRGVKGNLKLIERLSRIVSFFPETYNRKNLLSIDNLNKLLLHEIKIRENKTIQRKDPTELFTFQLFSYYWLLLKKKTYPMRITGYILRKSPFISFINKVFGSLYYNKLFKIKSPISKYN